MGTPMVPECFVEGWGWGGWLGELTSDIRPTLPVVIQDQWRSGKIDHFGGKCVFGGSDGPPVVPEC